MLLSKEQSKFPTKSFNFLIFSSDRYTLLKLSLRHIWSFSQTEGTWEGLQIIKIKDHKKELANSKLQMKS